MSPVLAGRFLTIGPLGKSWYHSQGKRQEVSTWANYGWRPGHPLVGAIHGVPGVPGSSIVAYLFPAHFSFLCPGRWQEVSDRSLQQVDKSQGPADGKGGDRTEQLVQAGLMAPRSQWAGWGGVDTGGLAESTKAGGLSVPPAEIQDRAGGAGLSCCGQAV